MISTETIELIKSRTVIGDVIGEFMKLKKEGSNLKGLCPFHGEQTPSFTVNHAKDMYKCFGCGRSGDSITFLMEHEKLSYTEALQWLAKKYSVTLEDFVPKRKNFVTPVARLEKLSPEVIRNFEEVRKISNNTLLRFNITEADEWMPKAQKVIRTICFNYYQEGELVNIKFRAKDKDFKLEKDARLIFYNIDAIKDVDEAVIVEGEIDMLTMHECGIYNVVSVPNGASVKGDINLEYLDNCWQYFSGKKKIVFMTDADETGLKLRKEMARRLRYERCYQVIFPGGCKDPNEVLQKFGKEAVISCYKNATEWPLEGILTVADVQDLVINIYENGYPNGFDVPLPGLRGRLQLMLGSLMVATGIPGSGKSEFIDWLMVEISKVYGWRWGINSYENQPIELHITKLIEKYSGRSFGKTAQASNRMPKHELGRAMEFVNEHFYFLNQNAIKTTVDNTLEKAGELVVRKGINGFLHDPWNRTEHKKEKEQDKLEYLNSSLVKFYTHAKINELFSIIVAHPTKIEKDKRTGKYLVPTLYNVSGGADWYNIPDYGMTVYRDYENGTVEVHINKVRFHWLGHVGAASYKFDTETRQYKTDVPMIENKPANLIPFNEAAKKWESNNGEEKDPWD